MKFNSVTETFIYFYTLVSIFLSVAYPGYLIYTKELWNSWIPVGVVLLGSLLIFGVLGAVKFVLEDIYDKHLTTKLAQWNTNLSVGLLGITICSAIPRILIYYTSYDNSVNFTCIALFIVAIVVFYLLFVRGFHQHCKFHNPSGNILSHCIAVVNTILLLIGLLESRRHTVEDKRYLIIFCQLVLYLIGAASSIELCHVWAGWLRLKSPLVAAHGMQNRPNPGTTRPECKICSFEYNDVRRIPRILKECGHTLCEACVNNLIRNGVQIHCPFCQKVTCVRGQNMNQLPKN